SLMLKLIFICSGDELIQYQCCSIPRHGNTHNAGADGVHHPEERRQDGCIGTLMACHLPPSGTYSELAANSNLTDDDFEFRARGGSFWSQTTTTLALSENGELLQSPIDVAPNRLLDFTLMPKSRPCSYILQTMSNNIAISQPGDHISNGPNNNRAHNLPNASEYSNTNSKEEKTVSKRRNMSFTLHQPIIHEIPFEMCQEVTENEQPKFTQNEQGNSSQKYLDMSTTSRQRLTRGRRNALFRKTVVKEHRQIVTSSLKKPKLKSRLTKKLRQYVNVCDKPLCLVSEDLRCSKNHYLNMAHTNQVIYTPPQNKTSEKRKFESLNKIGINNDATVENSSIWNASREANIDHEKCSSSAEGSSLSDSPLSTYDSDNDQFPSLSSSESCSNVLAHNVDKQLEKHDSPSSVKFYQNMMASTNDKLDFAYENLTLKDHHATRKSQDFIQSAYELRQCHRTTPHFMSSSNINTLDSSDPNIGSSNPKSNSKLAHSLEIPITLRANVYAYKGATNIHGLFSCSSMAQLAQNSVENYLDLAVKAQVRNSFNFWGNSDITCISQTEINNPKLYYDNGISSAPATSCVTMKSCSDGKII
ncbi:hypothetical protein SK128_026201, partial [Halocaridina rubra]